MKKHYLIIGLLVSSGAFASNFEGTYECVGNEVGAHEAFKCQLMIKKTGETYTSTETCSDGNSYKGIGIYDKSAHYLSTGFINPKKSEETGVWGTTVKRDGKLLIEWTYLDKTSTELATCIKQK